ncbi:unnamed protein product [Amoebophrya sp. A25]|nr:unnamed protein product [Amoebophrya sp. A25]|eukprot:GSA25T00017319001.1
MLHLLSHINLRRMYEELADCEHFNITNENDAPLLKNK